jgi:uncharacterized protein (TIGR03067 family)
MCWFNLLILLAPLAAGDGGQALAVKEELQQFQGHWRAVSILNPEGQRATEDEVQSTRLVVEGNKFTLTGKDFTVSGTFSINPARSPKTIDALLTSNDGKETKFLGIYEIRGDTRKSCFTVDGKPRPTGFLAEKGYFGFEWRRE